MATTYSLSGKVKDLVGGDLLVGSVRGYVEAWGGATTGTTAPDASALRLGPYPITFGGDGSWSVTGLPATGAGQGWDPPAQGHRVVIAYRPLDGSPERSWASDWFELTADMAMKDVQAAVIAAIQSAFAAAAAAEASATAAAGSATAAAGSAASAAASAQLAHDISGISTPDGVVAALINDAGSVTRTALDGVLAPVAFTGAYSDLSSKPTLGTAAAAATGDFASSTKGAAEKVATPGATTGTVTCDLSAGSVFTIAPTGNITLAFSNVPAAGTAATITVIVAQDASVRTVTMPGSVVWMVAAPTQAASKRCVFTLVTTDGGTTWLAWATVQA